LVDGVCSNKALRQSVRSWFGPPISTPQSQAAGNTLATVMRIVNSDFLRKENSSELKKSGEPNLSAPISAEISDREPFDWRAHVRVHPAADLLPLLPPNELRTLADDMAANGMLSFAVADKDGNLLDGRNRLDALALLGVLEPAPGGGIRITKNTTRTINSRVSYLSPHF
jgi:hypothetical protein